MIDLFLQYLFSPTNIINTPYVSIHLFTLFFYNHIRFEEFQKSIAT